MLSEERLHSLPTQPGVYLLKDERGNVLYIGKASSLRHRVKSHFTHSFEFSPKHQKMLSRVADVDFFITDSDPEAIILECQLIKKYRPKYNVRLKDDKSYPYLKIDLMEEWPRVYITRRWGEDGGRYFGPYASAGSVRTTLDVIKKLFPFRSCSKKIQGKEKRACIEYDIRRCLGPCIRAVTPEEYKGMINRVILFLEGKDESIKQELTQRMEEAAERWEFEKAALLRDQLQAVERVTQRQKLSPTFFGDLDAIALAQAHDLAYAQVFFIRQGKLLGKEAFALEGAQGEKPSSVITSFIKQFYASAPNIPPLILLQHHIEDALIQKWLEARRKGEVKLEVPAEGEKRELVNMVAKNALEGLEQYRIKQLTLPEALSSALEELEHRLCLPRLPHRVECYDISTIQGNWAVGSMVVFEGGRPKTAHYRRFKIKTVSGMDDYAMLKEVLKRRFKRGEQVETPWGIIPDLILIDGGKGQLNAGLEAMRELAIEPIPIASIAKEREEIYVPDTPHPISLPPGSALYLLQRIRDEAHRFALSYHLKVRRKSTFISALDTIPGIGAKRKRALLRKFGSIERIKEATIEDLASTPGITSALAHRLKKQL